MKNTIRILFPCLLVVFLLGASARNDPEQLLQAGHAAFARGDYTEAASLYERAEVHSTDPRRVAFYLAGAKYHLAVKTEGSSAELREAEQLYRCCLAPADPRRPAALFGLGNCFLHKAGDHDAASLRLAIACYDQCLQGVGGDEKLASDARYNRERARLLFLQFPPPANGSQSDKPPEDDENSQPSRPDRRPMRTPVGEQGNDGHPEDRAMGNAVKPEPGSAAAQSNDPPPPGKGNKDPVPDEVDVPPLPPAEAAEHLKEAANKVLNERKTFHRREERQSTTGVKDW
jgi:tetratricopeptide (TPR) repeat protein